MKMGQYDILDTYPAFSAYWKHVRFKSVSEQIKLWQASYMKKYPELLDKQVRSYEAENVNWQEIAKKIFPLLPHRFQLMRKARHNILAVCNSIYAKALERLELDLDIVFVIYVGIGCGAGWATKHEGRPAVLLGLENIAGQRWHTKSKLEGLMSHEIGHLAHMKWRNEWKIFEKAEQDPLFQLYSEGFAQRCEHVILGRETWHVAQDKKWLSWCKQNKSWLANEFLKSLEKQASVNDFFGSWFHIQCKTQIGYFLGYVLIRELEKTYNLRETALLDVEKMRELALRCLKHISNKAIK